MVFTTSKLIALLFSSARASPSAKLSEIDSSEGGASELLIDDIYSIATHRIFEYEIADDLASLKIKSVKESEQSKMIVVAE